MKNNDRKKSEEASVSGDVSKGEESQESLFPEEVTDRVDSPKDEAKGLEKSKESSKPIRKKEADPPKEEVNISKKPKESPGIILKRERESQGLSLDIVHEATKIPMDALKAIEEGYTIRMLSPFYLKGFLKIYSEYLGLDVSAVIEDYKSEELPEHIDQYADEPEWTQWVAKFFTRKRKQRIVIVIGALFVLFLFFKMIGFFMKKGPSSDIKKDVAKSEPAKKAPVKQALKSEVKKVAEKPSVQVQKEIPKIVIPKEVPEVKIAPKEIPPTPSPIKPSVVAVAPAVEKDITLTVRAKQNSWLSVKADGNIVFQSTLRLGAVETWIADDEIEISGKNIDQLEFELNGKLIGTLGRNDHNAKKVVITKNGLSVKN